jgi:hypothetical protein
MEALTDFFGINPTVNAKKLNKQFLFIGVNIPGIDNGFVEFLSGGNAKTIGTDNGSALGFGIFFGVNRGDITLMNGGIKHYGEENPKTEKKYKE